MKYLLNNLHTKTTNNFMINNLEIDLNIPKYKGKNDFQITGDLNSIQIEKEKKETSFNTKIGLEISEYLELKITIPKNVIIEEPILIDYAFEDNDVLFDKIIIEYEENSKCDFYITYISKDDTTHFHYLKEELKINKNAEGSISYINMMNNNSYNFIALENDSYENSNITHNIVDLGGKIRLYNAYSNLLERKAINNLNTIYIGQNESIIDINYYLKNTSPETTNNMQVEGALSDSCKKNFRGTIDFVKGCSNSIGEENENCILLSDTARSRSLPELLCGEENVIGSHGVSSGKVSEDKLFYLMSRAYSKKEAEKLIIMANFMKIINSIKHENIKIFIQNRIEELLS